MEKGLIYCPSGEHDWMKQFAMLPTPILRYLVDTPPPDKNGRAI